MNVFQSIAIWIIFVVICFLIYGCTSYDYKLDTINHKVNSYGYLSDDDYGKRGYKIMSPEQKGDCKDHAFTKCRMIKEQYPGREMYLLFREANANGSAHVALAVDGFVLDNQSPILYPYDKTKWTWAMKWSCMVYDV